MVDPRLSLLHNFEIQVELRDGGVTLSGIGITLSGVGFTL